MAFVMQSSTMEMVKNHHSAAENVCQLAMVLVRGSQSTVD